MTKTPDEHAPHIQDAPNETELQAFAADPTRWGKPKRVLTAAWAGRDLLRRPEQPGALAGSRDLDLGAQLTAGVRDLDGVLGSQ